MFGGKTETEQLQTLIELWIEKVSRDSENVWLNFDFINREGGIGWRDLLRRKGGRQAMTPVLIPDLTDRHTRTHKYT